MPVNRPLGHLQAGSDIGESGMIIPLLGKKRKRVREYARTRPFSLFFGSSSHLSQKKNGAYYNTYL